MLCDSDSEINFENLDTDLESINSKICNLELNVKEKADQNKKMAMANQVVSFELQDFVRKALSKHLNPVPCPVCNFTFDHFKNSIFNSINLIIDKTIPNFDKLKLKFNCRKYFI